MRPKYLWTSYLILKGVVLLGFCAFTAEPGFITPALLCFPAAALIAALEYHI